MRKSFAFLIPVVAALTFIPAWAQASNAGDFSGGVAIGTGYAGVNAAPTNGLLVQGNVAIGTTSPNYPLEIDATNSAGGNGWSAIIREGGKNGVLIGSRGSGAAVATIGGILADLSAASTLSLNPFGGSVGVGTASPRGGSELDVNGTLYVGTFAASSSTTVCQNSHVLSACTSARRFKKNIEPYALGLKEVLKMRPVTFDLKDHVDNWEKHDFGFVADDMAKINPLFVTYDDNGEISGVRYMQLTAVNAKAIQELNGIIKNQQDEIDELKRTVERLTHEK